MSVPVQFDWTITAGNVLTLMTMLLAFVVWAVKTGGDFRVLKEQVKAIVDKLDAFITKDVVAEKEYRAQSEHESMRADIQELKLDLNRLRNGPRR